MLGCKTNKVLFCLFPHVSIVETVGSKPILTTIKGFALGGGLEPMMI